MDCKPLFIMRNIFFPELSENRSGSIARKPYDRSSSGTLEYSAPEKVSGMFTYAESNVYVAG